MTSDIHSPSEISQLVSYPLYSHVFTSVEDKSVHADLLIARNAHPLYQFFLVRDRRQCRHEPAVTVVALSYIVRGGAFDEKSWFIEDVL